MVGQIGGDPAGEQIDRTEVELMRGERRHAGEAIAGQTLEHDGMIGIAWDDEFIERVTGIVIERAVYEAGHLEGEPGARVPGLRAGTASLMALHTILREIGADPGFQTAGFIGEAGEGRQRLRRARWITEVTGLAQKRDLISGMAIHGGALVQLAGVETQGVASHRGVTGEASGTRRYFPGLSNRIRAILDAKIDIRAAIRN